MKSAIKILCGSLCLATTMVAFPAYAETGLEEKATAFKSKMEDGSQPTLDDMAEAQNVLSGLQLVLEIEKVQAEIDETRRERVEASQPANVGFVDPMVGASLDQELSFGEPTAIPQISAPITPVIAPMPVAAPIIQEPSYDEIVPAPTPAYDSEIEEEPEIEEIERPEITVLKVLGSGGNLRARVQDMSGDTFDVYPGDDLEGATVLSVSSNGVRVDLGTKKVTLPIDLSAATRASFGSDF